MTNKKSFTNLQQWLTEVNEFASADVPKLLIGKLSQLVIVHLLYVMDLEKVWVPKYSGSENYDLKWRILIYYRRFQKTYLDLNANFPW